MIFILFLKVNETLFYFYFWDRSLSTRQTTNDCYLFCCIPDHSRRSAARSIQFNFLSYFRSVFNSIENNQNEYGWCDCSRSRHVSRWRRFASAPRDVFLRPDLKTWIHTEPLRPVALPSPSSSTGTDRHFHFLSLSQLCSALTAFVKLEINVKFDSFFLKFDSFIHLNLKVSNFLCFFASFFLS